MSIYRLNLITFAQLIKIEYDGFSYILFIYFIQ